MEQRTAKVFELNELIRFYAQVASTEGMDDEVKRKCNELITKLLVNVKGELGIITAQNSGLITG